MIKLTRLGGEPFVLNADLIRYVEARPDTFITAHDRRPCGRRGVDGRGAPQSGGISTIEIHDSGGEGRGTATVEFALLLNPNTLNSVRQAHGRQALSQRKRELNSPLTTHPSHLVPNPSPLAPSSPWTSPLSPDC